MIEEPVLIVDQDYIASGFDGKIVFDKQDMVQTDDTTIDNNAAANLTPSIEAMAGHTDADVVTNDAIVIDEETERPSPSQEPSAVEVKHTAKKSAELKESAKLKKNTELKTAADVSSGDNDINVSGNVADAEVTTGPVFVTVDTSGAVAAGDLNVQSESESSSISKPKPAEEVTSELVLVDTSVNVDGESIPVTDLKSPPSVDGPELSGADRNIEPATSTTSE